jgi:hypothetical protein
VNILLLAASALALLFAVLKPLGDGLFDTSAWVAKTLTPPDADEGKRTTIQEVRAGRIDGRVAE